MAQEWFTLAELRALLPDTFDGIRAHLFATKFAYFRKELARVRAPKPGQELHELEPEFHLNTLWHGERAALAKMVGISIEHRIYRLGIHRAVINSHDSHGIAA